MFSFGTSSRPPAAPSPATKPAPPPRAPVHPLWFRLPGSRPEASAPATLSPADDPLERQAERTAEHVTSGPDAGAGGAAAGTGAPGGDGAPLPGPVRERFEPRFGHAFPEVRVHADARAAEMASSLSARAFTVGSHIVFGAGQYRPEEAAGQRLLAHELAHVVQQGASRETARATGAAPVVRAIGGGPRVQRVPEGEAESQELRSRVAALSDDELILLLEELYRRIPPGSPGRTGAGTPDDPAEDYAAQLRQNRVAEPSLGSFGGGGAGSISRAPWLGGSALPLDPIAVLGVRAGLTESVADVAARVLPLAEAEARVRLRGRGVSMDDLFVAGSPGSWSHVLPPAPATRAQAQLQQHAIQVVRERLDAVAVPTRSGHLRRRRRGFQYTAAHDHADDHLQYVRGGDQVLGLRTAQERRRWEIFRFVMRSEGDTSAINSYDDQVVTVGAGYSASSGLAQRVFRRMPEAFRQQLFEHGIEVNDDNTFSVLDLATGTVVHGDDANRVLQGDERRLSLIIRLAQSEEEMTQGGTTRPAREWMLRAQFEQLTSTVPVAVLDRWDLGIAKVAVKMHHWQPSVATWRDLSAWSGGGTDVHAMARGARDAIWNFHGRPAAGAFSLDSIEARFQHRATEARLGRLTFQPRPPE